MENKKISFTIQVFCQATGIGKFNVYELLSSSEIDAVKCGRRTLITTSPNDFLATLPAMRDGGVR